MKNRFYCLFNFIQNRKREEVKRMKRVRSKRGQSTVEYVIVFTAIAAAIIFAAINVIRPAVNTIYTDAGNSITGSGSFFANRIGFGKVN